MLLWTGPRGRGVQSLWVADHGVKPNRETLPVPVGHLLRRGQGDDLVATQEQRAQLSLEPLAQEFDQSPASRPQGRMHLLLRDRVLGTYERNAALIT